MTATTDAILDSFQSLATVFGASEYANMCAIGVATDDPASPGATAVVFQGKLYALVIPDSYTSFDGRTLTDIVNGVIVNAYAEWQADRQRLVVAAAR